MKLSRNTTNNIRYVLDELLPPFLRDSRVFMSIPMRLFFGKNASLVMDFKSQAPSMSPEAITKVYELIEGYSNERVTDLNTASITKIVQKIKGKTVLDVGCGRGYLAFILAKKSHVTGVDIVVDSSLKKNTKNPRFVTSAIENLPFPDHSFDTVVCTHTIEHVTVLQLAIKELRRVAKKRLIIVTPMQRPYKYTFDLHLQFFPYKHSLLQMIQSTYKNNCEIIDGDLFYVEDYSD